MGAAKKKRAASKASAITMLVPALEGEGFVPSDLDFSWVPIDQVRVWVKNPRKNAEAIPKVKASLKRFGWGRPLIANRTPGYEGELIVGHTAWAAAKELGLKLVPVRWRMMEPAKAHALAIADNKTSEFSAWDHQLLGSILGGAELSQDDWLASGFSKAELQHIMTPDGPENDAVPEPPKRPVTKPGDLWVLGDHRLVCGDATDPALVALLLDGQAPELLVTDPPYGVNLDSTWRDQFSPVKQKHTGKIANDGRRDWTEAYKLFPGSVAYVWHAGVYAAEVAAHLNAVQLQIRAQVIWAKSALVMGRGAYHWQHEPCWYAVRKGASSAWIGGRKQTTLWQIASKVGFTKKGNEDVDTKHGSQKPVECMARPIRNHTGNVYDPFVGSGTTLIAAQHCERRCFAVELDPPWVDVIVERWQNLTGEKAQRVKAAA